MCRVLLVEDEIFVAVEMEYVVSEIGYQPVGIATDSRSALELASSADVALVDVNLRDGRTGPDIGRTLAEKHGVTVLFITANPSQLGGGVPGTLGVIAKPLCEDELKEAVRFAAAHRASLAMEPPSRLTLFAPTAS